MQAFLYYIQILISFLSEHFVIYYRLPALCSGIVVLILKSDFQDYNVNENDFFHFFNEKVS